MKAAVALSERKSDDMGRVDRRGAKGGGVTPGELEALFTVDDVTDSGLVLDVAGAFKLVGTGLPLGGMAPDDGADIPGRRRMKHLPDYRHDIRIW